MTGLTSVRANFNRLEASNTLDDWVGVAIWRDWADWVNPQRDFAAVLTGNLRSDLRWLHQ